MADHVGIYEIRGKLMASPTCKVSPSSQITEKDVRVPDFGFVISENRSTHHEAVVHNAYFSGTEAIESPPSGVIVMEDLSLGHLTYPGGLGILSNQHIWIQDITISEGFVVKKAYVRPYSNSTASLRFLIYKSDGDTQLDGEGGTIYRPKTLHAYSQVISSHTADVLTAFDIPTTLGSGTWWMGYHASTDFSTHSNANSRVYGHSTHNLLAMTGSFNDIPTDMSIFGWNWEAHSFNLFVEGYWAAANWVPAKKNLYYVKNSKFQTYEQISQKSYEFTGSLIPEGRTNGITTNAAEDSYAVLVNFTQRLSGSATISSGTLYIPAIEPDPEASEGSDSVDAARVYNETIGLQTSVAQANDANAYLSRQDYTRTTEERWVEANEERANAESLDITEDATVAAGSDSSARTQVDPSLTPITLMNARSNRKGGSIYNGTTTPMYLSLGGVATTTSFSAKLYPDDLYELPGGWLGSVSGVWASIGTGKAQVIEYI